MSFQKYGSVTIDWPHKIHSKSRVPPKGDLFMLIVPFKTYYSLTCQ